MAKKNKKNDDLPEGMSRRQAKLAKRAAERAALEKDPRPYGGFAAEADLVALQEFVPSATAAVEVKGAVRPIRLVTVLPGAAAALVREEKHGGEALVALQVQARSHNPGRDLAYALKWAAQAGPGETLMSTAADGTQPALVDLLDPATALDIEVHQDFSWWVPESMAGDATTVRALQAANDAIVPSHCVDAEVPGAAWWVYPGGDKAHIRWVRTEDNEERLLAALARIAARGELNLGEGSRFAGTFRTHGLVVPVFDLDPARAHETYAQDLAALNTAIEAEVANEAPLNAEERKQLQNIKSRQVTIR
ncbi:preprotein translocase subunit SecA [Corynebacterium sp. zg-331]|uniref:DUF5926 family protein n=1 Tax=unclassified Corynebacterium TaxID=2624378 RepID=UPI00128C2DB4|nr:MULTISPECIES: DUF5926 family protein [unclassified Corynebacterium]MBC3186823.1 preprotein translocase subunit SecA [Corynebacterium sp. zg-331]MPV53303.1 preprotein translocase subunit SecA [Corynebacterium sp. zg331]